MSNPDTQSNEDNVYCLGCQKVHEAGIHLLDDQPSPTQSGKIDEIRDPFYAKATMRAGTEPDGGDSWVISKKDFNEYIAALTARENRMVQEAKAEAYKMGLMTGGMPEFIGKPMAEDYLAQLTQRSHDDE